VEEFRTELWVEAKQPLHPVFGIQDSPSAPMHKIALAKSVTHLFSFMSIGVCKLKVYVFLMLEGEIQDSQKGYA
jgi:hypothetical protein